MKRLAVVCAVSALFACGGKKSDDRGGGGGTCAPLKVTIDGAEVPGLVHGYALTQIYKGERSEQVVVLNREETCANLLSKAGRPTPDGEIDVRANAGASTMTRGVGLGSHTQLGVDVKLLGAAPKAVGDKVTLCVPVTSFTGADDHKGKAVVVSGTFTGTWCGTMEF